MATNWHGYPQHPDAHPDRPWWRHFGPVYLWVRTDGHDARFVDHELEASPAGALATQPLRDRWVASHSGGAEAPTTEELMEAIDKWWPMPVPPPMCGQVWLHLELGLQDVIGPRVWKRGENRWQVWGLTRPFGSPSENRPRHFGEGAEVWPPIGRVLVAGPGAPWASADATREG